MPVYLHESSYSLGSHRVTHQEIQSDNPNWDLGRLSKKTGVHSLPKVEDNETALDMGERACNKLLNVMNIDRDDIDGLLFCTETADHAIPPNACLLHGRLGLKQNLFAMDISLACSGFTHSLMVARGLLESRQVTNLLLILGDSYSQLIHPNDRSVRPIFGDGVSACLLSCRKGRFEIIDGNYGSNGENYKYFHVESGGARHRDKIKDGAHLDYTGTMKSRNHIQMDGKGLLDFFSPVIPETIDRLLEKNNLSTDDIDHFICHQASALILNHIRSKLKLPAEKVHNRMAHTGNLVSASVPVALEQVYEEGLIKPGQYIVLAGFGAGLSWSTILLKSC